MPYFLNPYVYIYIELKNTKKIKHITLVLGLATVTLRYTQRVDSDIVWLKYVYYFLF